MSIDDKPIKPTLEAYKKKIRHKTTPNSEFIFPTFSYKAAQSLMN